MNGEGAKNTLDVATFARPWKDACEFGLSFAAAKAVKNGSLDEKSFHDYYSSTTASALLTAKARKPSKWAWARSTRCRRLTTIFNYN
ncbi:MAG: hypothetical protein AB7K68_14730 [Bacteriovoracia bacterium]